MAEYIPFGEPVNESERQAFFYLRDNLPKSYKLFTNLEIKQYSGQIYEIDLILVAPHCVYVVDVKNWRGRIEVNYPYWDSADYQSVYSPLKKLREHTKKLSNIICNINRANPDLRKIHIQSAILMTAKDVEVIEHGDIKDAKDVTYLDKRCLDYFQSDACIVGDRYKDIKGYISIVEKAISGKARPRSAPKRYQDWQVEEDLSGDGDRCKEYRAKKIKGMKGLTVRLRVYQVDSLLEPAKQEQQYKLISTAFEAVSQLSAHANILNVLNFFESREHDCLVIVTEDVPGQLLYQQIKNKSLNWEQKVTIIKDVLSGLGHAHKQGVIHRNITPETILVTAKGQARLINFDYARISDRTGTIANYIVQDLEKYAVYQAIECQSDPSKASVVSDLFSAGLVFYELLTEFVAFEDANQIYECEAVFPVKPSGHNPQLSPGWDNWLQKLCAFDPKHRYNNAEIALQELESLISSNLDLDINDLPQGEIIDNQYRVIKRLGRPGSFAVAYHAYHNLYGELVLKLVTRDKRSVYERLEQEYNALRQVPEHPYIVKVIWAGQLRDDTPFIAFEYIDGKDVETLIESKTLSREKAVEIAQQTATGLSHLHQHQVRHQDIKPSNLFLTDKGIRIIDFNVAVSDNGEITASAGTRRYMPPDCKPTLDSTTSEKVDRDLYALGIVFYECVTGSYPFDEPQPPIGKLPHNPREIKGCEDLSDELVQLLMQAIAPKRADRFTSAEEFLKVINSLPSLIKSQGQAELQTSAISDKIAILELQQPLAITSLLRQPFNLSDAPQLTSQSQINLDKPIVLDPKELYDIHPGYIAITTEVEWMQSFGINDSPCWVKGEMLCEWTREWLQAWDKMDAVAEIKQDPRLGLEALFHPLPLPSQWNSKQLLAIATRLDSYPQDNPIAHLLAEITVTDTQIWLPEPSIENFAAWLIIQIPQEWKPLEQVWQNHFPECDLTSYYQTEDKLLLLRRWLGIIEPTLTEFGKYPLPVPDVLAEEFDQYWEQKISRSEGKILDDIIPIKQSGMERIANSADRILRDRPHWQTKDRVTKIAGFLNSQGNPRKSIQRERVLIFCCGEGKAKQPGQLEITIDNLNSVPLTDLYLYIPELTAFKTGKFLEEKIPANERLNLQLLIPEMPELPPTYEGNILFLSGELTFKFANGEAGNATLAPDSTITINQIFSSGFDIDEFL